MFKKHRGLFTRPVEVALGETYQLTLEIPSEGVFSTPLPTLVGDPPHILGTIRGWADVNDTDTGEPLELNAANWAAFVADPCIEGAVWRTLSKLRTEAMSGELLRGNSKTPPVGGLTAATATQV